GCGRDERPARNDDVVTRTNAERIQRQLQSHGAICDRNRIFALHRCRKLFFKLSPVCPCPVIHLSRPEHRGGSINFLRIDIWPGSKHSRTNGATALQSQLPFNSQSAGSAHGDPRTSSVRLERSFISRSTASCSGGSTDAARPS